MGLQFPNILRVRMVDLTGRPVSGHFAVSLRLHAPVKNDYSVLKVTSPDASALFTLDEVENEIRRSKQLFLMDYASALQDCDDQVTVRILSKDDVRLAVRAHTMHQRALGIPDEHIRALNEAENRMVEPTERKVRLTTTLPIITVDIAIAWRTQG